MSDLTQEQQACLDEIDARLNEALKDSYYTVDLGMKLDEGCKYARWAIFPFIMDQITLWQMEKRWEPDNIFTGTVFGKPQTIFMWVPRFD